MDGFWTNLPAGGRKVQCGWLKAKYRASWRIVPMALGGLLSAEVAAKSLRVMPAMLKMVKLDIKRSKEAAKGNQAT